jgi:Domain of unknown function (DUF4252)
MTSRSVSRQNPLWSIGAVCVATILWSAFGTLPARAQSARLQLGALDELAHKAQHVTEVSLDQQMLQLAVRAMTKDEQARRVMEQLKGVYIRNYEFRNEGDYSQADVDAILDQVRAARWQTVVSKRDFKTNQTHAVYMMGKDDAIRGLAIISAGPRQLTVVNIVGPIDLRKLTALEGHLGIPHVNLDQEKEEPEPAQQN